MCKGSYYKIKVLYQNGPIVRQLLINEMPFKIMDSLNTFEENVSMVLSRLKKMEYQN